MLLKQPIGHFLCVLFLMVFDLVACGDGDNEQIETTAGSDEAFTSICREVQVDNITRKKCSCDPLKDGKCLLLLDGIYAISGSVDAKLLDLSAPLLIEMNANIDKAAFGRGYTGSMDLIFLYEDGTEAIDYTTRNISGIIEGELYIGERLRFSPFSLFDVPVPTKDQLLLTEVKITVDGNQISEIQFFDNPLGTVSTRHLIKQFSGELFLNIPLLGYTLPGTFEAKLTEQ